jgi:EAL domain-containing protein (putative c-di-GMP-specific phosphodiesterase class I)
VRVDGLVERAGAAQPWAGRDAIRRVERELLEAAFLRAANWQARGRRLGVGTPVSPPTLHDPALPRYVRRLVGSAAVPARLVTLLVREPDPDNLDWVRAALLHLRDAGFRLALDGFGAGDSSLSVLRDLPLDELIVSEAFVVRAAAEPSARALVRAAVDIGRTLGLAVVAAGVDSDRTLHVVQELGCDLAQGPLFGGARLDRVQLDEWLDTATEANPAGEPVLSWRGPGRSASVPSPVG